MQTFLPYRSFERSAEVLDYRRLGKQRVECKQLLLALTGESSSWINHPAAKMWVGHERSLCKYAIAICKEWRRRSYNDSLLPFFKEKLKTIDPDTQDLSSEAPSWLGKKKFHASHRSNLLRKDPEHYGAFGWSEGPDLPYFWPV